MADEADQADTLVERMRQIGIERITGRERPAQRRRGRRVICIACGEPIPPARAATGAARWIDCQVAEERRTGT